MNKKNDGPVGGRKRFLWSLLSLAIAALSVWAVTSQAKGFSPKNFSEYIDQNNPWWLAAAAVTMLAYIVLNAMMVDCLLKGFGFRQSFPKNISYAAADIYFSAITPSGTGGQPVEGYLMVKDGIPGVISTVVMITNLLFYTMAIVLLGALGLILRPSSFLRFGVFSRILIVIGILIQLTLSTFYALLLWKKRLMRHICDWFLRVLAKLHLIHNLEKKQGKLYATMEKYGEATELLKGKRKLMARGLILNVLHRACQILVTVFCFLAGGGSWKMVPDLFAMQSNVVLGAYCIPIPGSMGVTDYMMLDGFSSMGMTEARCANLELLSRGLSFYICILLCGIIVLMKYAIIRFRREKK